MESRPFESAKLEVKDVPQWTGCVDVPGSAVAEAKKVGAAVTYTHLTLPTTPYE